MSKNTKFILLILVIVGVAVALYLSQSQTSFFSRASNPYAQYKPIQSLSDLDKMLLEVESSDLNVIDTAIQENTTEESSVD